MGHTHRPPPFLPLRCSPCLLLEGLPSALPAAARASEPELIDRCGRAAAGCLSRPLPAGDRQAELGKRLSLLAPKRWPCLQGCQLWIDAVALASGLFVAGQPLSFCTLRWFNRSDSEMATLTRLGQFRCQGSRLFFA